MAIASPGLLYDINRDVFYTDRERYERELYRQKEDEYRRQQALMQNPSYNPYFEVAERQALNKVQQPTAHEKDPLNFLQKIDKKLLLTGEAP
jgi:hypothetical protein